MRRRSRKAERLLGVHPTSKGFGFVIFEGAQSLIDWGVVGVTGALNPESRRRVAVLLDRYTPSLIVVEDYFDKTSRRCARIQWLLKDIINLAALRNIRSQLVSRRAVRDLFVSEGNATKHQVAVAIAKRFPELAPRVPPPRKPWMSQDERMSIFDASALALVALNNNVDSLHTGG